jgi:hypothetical protein
MDYCFNSICPNDLISNIEKLEDSSQNNNNGRKESILNQKYVVTYFENNCNNL